MKISLFEKEIDKEIKEGYRLLEENENKNIKLDIPDAEDDPNLNGSDFSENTEINEDMEYGYNKHNKIGIVREFNGTMILLPLIGKDPIEKEKIKENKNINKLMELTISIYQKCEKRYGDLCNFREMDNKAFLTDFIAIRAALFNFLFEAYPTIDNSDSYFTSKECHFTNKLGIIPKILGMTSVAKYYTGSNDLNLINKSIELKYDKFINSPFYKNTLVFKQFRELLNTLKTLMIEINKRESKTLSETVQILFYNGWYPIIDVINFLVAVSVYERQSVDPLFREIDKKLGIYNKAMSLKELDLNAFQRFKNFIRNIGGKLDYTIQEATDLCNNSDITFSEYRNYFYEN